MFIEKPETKIYSFEEGIQFLSNLNIDSGLVTQIKSKKGRLSNSDKIQLDEIQKEIAVLSEKVNQSHPNPKSFEEVKETLIALITAETDSMKNQLIERKQWLLEDFLYYFEIEAEKIFAAESLLNLWHVIYSIVDKSESMEYLVAAIEKNHQDGIESLITDLAYSSASSNVIYELKKNIERSQRAKFYQYSVNKFYRKLSTLWEAHESWKFNNKQEL